ncbi:MAG: toprim domain-containing protein [Nanoarchaeota archaeon]
MSPEDTTSQVQPETLLGAWESAFEKFRDALQRSDFAKDYLTETRGLTPETITKFRVGYAPDNFHLLTNERFVEEEGYSLETLKQAGLAKQSESGAVYDTFRNRIVVPVMNQDGRIIGATGRDLSSDKKVPKYINGSETPIYSKRNNLLGLSHARKTIRDNGQAIFVEGAFDVLQAHQQGYTQVIAPCGTALTSEQLDLVDKLGNQGDIEKILMFDGDSAGLASMERLCREHLGRGLKVVLISGDPDELLRKPYGKESLDSDIAFASQGGLEFIVHRALNARGDKLVPALEDKLLILQGLQPSFKSLAPEKRGLYTGELSKLLDLPSEDIHSFFYPNPSSSASSGKLNNVFWQSQFIRILFTLAKQERATNSLTHLVQYCDSLNIRPLLTMPEAKAAFTYIEHHIQDLPYTELDTPLFGNSAMSRVCGQIEQQARTQLDSEVLQKLFDSSLIAYPARGEKSLSQDLLNTAIAELFKHSIHQGIGESYHRKKMSLEDLSNLNLQIKRGKGHGKKTN